MATTTKSRSRSSDRRRVSSEDHEIEYIHEQFPRFSHAKIRSAIASCKRKGGTVSRTRIMACLRAKA